MDGFPRGIAGCPSIYMDVQMSSQGGEGWTSISPSMDIQIGSSKCWLDVQGVLDGRPSDPARECVGRPSKAPWTSNSSLRVLWVDVH